jgi:hypothetical protein
MVGFSLASPVLAQLGPAESSSALAPNRPTVSPYLNLLRANPFESTGGLYQTMVRPQMESYQNAARTQAALSGLQQRVSQLRTALPPEAAERRPHYPTGHPTLFMGYMHFYPALGRR